MSETKIKRTKTTKKQKYIIEPQCTKYFEGSCILHNKKKYPCICALYPIMLVEKNKKVKLSIDKNCPRWKEVNKKFKNKEFLLQLQKVIEYYKKNNALDVFEKKELIKCGYELKIKNTI
jgi:hypothetical protein